MSVPLCVGLSGPLVPNDLASEAVLGAVAGDPRTLLKLPGGLLRGSARAEASARVADTLGFLPAHPDLVEMVAQARADGREIVLTGAAPAPITAAVAQHFGPFDEVLTVEPDDADSIPQRLVERFGTNGFDFVGGEVDGDRVRSSARATTVFDPLPDRPPTWRLLGRAIRMHQWLKNLLVFVPVLAGQRWGDSTVVLQAVVAFAAFSMVASSVYVINDVVDLAHDRRHATKRTRPFASGYLPVSWAAPMAFVLIALGVAAAFWLPGRFQIALGVYYFLTFAYSLRLKGTVLIDVMTLAGLYTLRVVAGAMATGIEPSVWLLGFSLFFFFSLALVKRYAELHRAISDGSTISEEGLPGRGYQLRDLPVLIGLGIGSGCMAVLVLALYVIGDDFSQHYTRPILLWQLCPLALYWIGRAWIVVARDEMTDDPVVWAFQDELSRWVGLAALILLLLAR